MLDLNDGVRETAWTEAYSSSKPFSCGADVKANYDPERWELFEREIEVSLMRIHSLQWVEEKSWTGGDSRTYLSVAEVRPERGPASREATARYH